MEQHKSSNRAVPNGTTLGSADLTTTHRQNRVKIFPNPCEIWSWTSEVERRSAQFTLNHFGQPPFACATGLNTITGMALSAHVIGCHVANPSR